MTKLIITKKKRFYNLIHKKFNLEEFFIIIIVVMYNSHQSQFVFFLQKLNY